MAEKGKKERSHAENFGIGANRFRIAFNAETQSSVAILELANRAAELFEKQSGSEKRRLLDFVLSNSTWGNGELRVKFRQPFDLIALGTTELKQKKAAGVDSVDLYQLKYARQDSNL